MLLTVHGNDVYYDAVDFNGSDAPVVVFIHGALNDHHVWAVPAQTFAAQGWRVLAVDLPGHGRSQGPALTGIAALAQWLLALLDVAGVESTMLVGHSMGALIALDAAALAPRRIQRLALLGATAPMPVSSRLLATARDDQDAAIELVSVWSHRRDGADAALVDATRQLQRRVAAASTEQLLHIDLAACNAYQHGMAAASAVRCPTLLLLGQHDLMTPPRSAIQLTAALEHCRVIEVDSGHALMAEQPAAVSEALLNFGTA